MTTSPAPVDFERACLAWETKSGSHGRSHGRWRLLASTLLWPDRQAEPTRHVLAAMVMAGDVYGAGRLPHDPPYSYQMIVSADRHAIVRAYPLDGAGRDTAGANSEIFTRLTIHAPALNAERLDLAALTTDRIDRAWPLTARIASPTGSEPRWQADFPVGHINVAQGGRFQVETGPILLPGAALEGMSAAAIDGFLLAYAFFNRADGADLLLWQRSGAARAYSRFARLDGVSIELFGRGQD